LYVPDPRNRWHQKHCSQPACRRASKSTGQRRWRRSPKGCDYFKGHANVLRVQAWRKAHPGYWRKRRKKALALQDDLFTQLFTDKKDKHRLNEHALQDVLNTQSSLLVGLVANLTGSPLQDHIASTAHRLILLGQQVQGRGRIDDDRQEGALSAALAPRAGAVQLDRSTPGSG
jgi:hypothetical protein